MLTELSSLLCEDIPRQQRYSSQHQREDSWYLFWDLEEVNLLDLSYDKSPESEQTGLDKLHQDNGAGKRFVHFADSEGKPLVTVRHFEREDANADDEFYCDGFDTDQYGSWQISAYRNLRFKHVQSKTGSRPRSSQHPQVSRVDDGNYLEMLFPDPLSNYPKYVTEKLRTQNVALESVFCRANNIKGLVRVHNLGYVKNVFVRLSWDGWATFHDWKCDLFTAGSMSTSQCSQFEFLIPLPPHLKRGSIVEFCICYRCGDYCEFWDNNYGKNWSLRYNPRHVKTANQNDSDSDGESESATQFRNILWSEFALWNSFDTSNLKSGKHSSSELFHRRLSPSHSFSYW